MTHIKIITMIPLLYVKPKKEVRGRGSNIAGEGPLTSQAEVATERIHHTTTSYNFAQWDLKATGRGREDFLLEKAQWGRKQFGGEEQEYSYTHSSTHKEKGEIKRGFT